MANQIQGLRPDGTLPTAAVEHVQRIMGESSPSPILVGGEQPASGWWLDTDGRFTPPAQDLTPPVAGTLSVTPSATSAVLRVTGASDNQGSVQYAFSQDNGVGWTPWQGDAESTLSELTPATGYAFRHRVRDLSGNVTVGTMVPATTEDFASEFRSLMLSHQPTQYWPLGDPVGTVTTALTNLGDPESGMRRTLEAAGAMGAPTLGDGNTAAATDGTLGQRGRLSRLSTDYRTGPWTLLTLVAPQSAPVGSNPLDGVGRFHVHAINGLTFIAQGFTGSVSYQQSVRPEETAGPHMLAITWDGTALTAYWDGQPWAVIPAATNNVTENGLDVTVMGTTPGRYSSIAHWKGTALTAPQINALYDSLGWED